MSNKKNNTTIDLFSIIKLHHNSQNKDAIISELNQQIKKLSIEINRLSSENSDLKKRYSLNYTVQSQLRTAEETIKNLREENLQLMLEHKNKESELGKSIDKILLEKKKEKLLSDKNEVLYMQKMLIANRIEMENRIYKDEIEKMKKQMELNEDNAKDKITKLEIHNLVKYRLLKNKILNNLNETKTKLANLNLKFMDNTSRTMNLQNYQLLLELEEQKQENEKLIKENQLLNKELFEIRGDLDIHKKVELELAEKIKKLQSKTNNLENNNNINTNLTDKKLAVTSTSFFPRNNKNLNDNVNIIIQKLKKIKVLNENEKNKNLGNRKLRKNNSYQTLPRMNKTQFEHSFLPSKSYFYRDISDLSVISKNSKLISDDKFNNNLKNINLTPDDNLLLKLKNVSIEKKYINLFNYLEKCLENFYSDIKSKMKRKNIFKIDFEGLRKLKFNEYNKKEQYILLILLMNHILPLIYVYFNSNSSSDILENNLFKTDLNLNYTILNKIYGNTNNIIRRAFLNKDNNKLTVELCMDKLGETIKRNSLSDLLINNNTKFS